MFGMDSSERLRGEVPFELQRWALTCKLLGVNDETIAKESEGRLTLEQLRVLGRSLEGDPLHAAAADLVMLLKRHEWLADVRRQVELVGRWGTRVERRKTPPAKVFFDEYFATNRPVVLTDFGKAWPAKKKWTNAYLRRTCGDATVKVVHNREKTHLYDAKAKALSRELRFSDFIDWVEAHPTSNDRYLVGNNDALSNPLVATLLKDCRYDTTYFDPRRVEGCAYLWFGPGGTVTPLHHDTVNIILTQVRGTKHFTLISPAHTALLHDSHAYYSLLDLDGPDRKNHPSLRNANIVECTVGPGESVFIPAGWWHHVRSESVSISLTLTNFRVPNAYEATNPIATPWKT